VREARCPLARNALPLAPCTKRVASCLLRVEGALASLLWRAPSRSRNILRLCGSGSGAYRLAVRSARYAVSGFAGPSAPLTQNTSVQKCFIFEGTGQKNDLCTIFKIFFMSAGHKTKILQKQFIVLFIDFLMPSTDKYKLFIMSQKVIYHSSICTPFRNILHHQNRKIKEEY
jgi:hypothetical protein